MTKRRLVVHGAMLKCSEGLAPATFAVPMQKSSSETFRVGTVQDNVPMVNVPAFGMCKTQANPQVAAATSAASGVLTPMPCVPIISAPWSGGSSISSTEAKALLVEDSTCSCQWGGRIEVTEPGTKVTTT